MQDFEFKRCTRRCSGTEKEIPPGETYYSVIIESDEGIERKDFAEDQWNGPPEGAIGWWQSRIPVLEKGKIYWAPNRVLMAYFESVSANAKQKETTYVMALLLVRKRVLQWKDSVTHGETEVMQLRHVGEKKVFEIEVVDLSNSQIQQIQNELAEQLFTDVIEEDDIPDDPAQESA